MKLLQRYIGKTLLRMILLVTLILFSLLLFIIFIDEMRNIGRGDYNFFQALIYVLLKTPEQLYVLFPMIGLLGSLIGLSLLASNRELMIMRVTGVSVIEITWMVLKKIFLFVLIVTLIGETFVPWAKHMANTRKTVLMHAGKVLKTKQGFWVREGQTFIHIQNILPGERFFKVNQYTFDKQRRLKLASYSREAVRRGDGWELHNTSESKISDEAINVENHDVKPWDISFSPGLLAISNINAAEMNFLQLYRYIYNSKQGGLQLKNYELSFWKRVLQPLSTCVMILLAVPFVFGFLRSSNMGLRILVGIVVGFSFYLLNEFFGSVSILYQFPPLFAAILPASLFLLLGYFLLRKCS